LSKEGAGKMRKRVVLTIKAKTDIHNRHDHGEDHKKLMKEYGYVCPCGCQVQ
jgi:hypothetical protein